MKIKSNGEPNYKAQLISMDSRTFQSYWIAHEFKLDPREIEENWGDIQIIEAISFIQELYKKK